MSLIIPTSCTLPSNGQRLVWERAKGNFSPCQLNQNIDYPIRWCAALLRRLPATVTVIDTESFTCDEVCSLVRWFSAWGRGLSYMYYIMLLLWKVPMARNRRMVGSSLKLKCGGRFRLWPLQQAILLCQQWLATPVGAVKIPFWFTRSTMRTRP